MTIRQVALSEIRLDGGTQIRKVLDLEYAEELAQVYKDDPEKLPPVTLFDDGKLKWLADGFHRHRGASMAKRKMISAVIKKGSKRDAQLHALGANADHGLRRNRQDKRNAVLTMLADKEWKDKSDRFIADVCQVSPDLVGDIRREQRGEPTRKQAKAQEQEDKLFDDEDDDDNEELEPVGSDTPKSVEPVKDEVGQPITDTAILAAFNRRGEIRRLMQIPSDLKSTVKGMVGANNPLVADLDENQFEAACNNLHRMLRFCQPYAVCPWCQGDHANKADCRACKGRGWVNQLQYDQAPAEFKKVG